jgi:hypothetical protein
MNSCRLTIQEPIFSVSNTEFEGGDDGHGHGDHTFLVKQAQPSHTALQLRRSNSTAIRGLFMLYEQGGNSNSNNNRQSHLPVKYPTLLIFGSQINPSWGLGSEAHNIPTALCSPQAPGLPGAPRFQLTLWALPLPVF